MTDPTLPPAGDAPPMPVLDAGPTRRAVEDSQERTLLSWADRRSRRVRIGFPGVWVLVLIGLVVAGVGPVLWLAKAAISTTHDTLASPLAMFPSGVQWHNLTDAWNVANVGLYLFNTLVIAVGSTVVSVIVSATAAYVLSVLRPRWGNVLSVAVLSTLFVPSVVSLVPLYLTVSSLPLVGTSLLNTYWAVWLPAGANAFNVVVIKRFFDSLPAALFEAARIDGAGPLRLLTSIVLPLSRPILGVVALLALIASWKDYLWPLLVLQDQGIQPLSVALPELTNTTPLSIQLAAMLISLVIPVVLFIAFQRQFLRGVGMAGSLKG